MKLIYATSILLPSPLANRIQILNMAEVFSRSLGKDFTLGIGVDRENNKFNYRMVKMGENIKSYFLAIKYLRYAKKNNVTHVYSREEKLLFFIILYNLLWFRLSLNYVYESHFVPKYKFWWFILMLKYCQVVVVLTSFIKKELLNINSTLNIIIAPDGVDIHKFDLDISQVEARRSLSLPLDVKIVVYTGSFYRYVWKGIGTLIEAGKLLDRECLFVLVGARPEEIKLIESSTMSSNLVVRGRQNHSNIPLYLKSADILVLPNEKGDPDSEKYTSPLKLFEYMAASRPIVASRLPSIEEVLNNKNALLVKSSDAEALAEGIRMVLDNENLAESIAKQSRQDVEDYDWKKRGEKIINFINEVTNKHVFIQR